MNLEKKYRIKIADSNETFNDETGWVNPFLDETCLNDDCKDCHGTGKKANGTLCVHYTSCGCSKCRWFC